MRFEYKLLVVCHLEVETSVELVLHPLGEYPSWKMANMSMTTRTTPGIEDEPVLLLIFVQNPFEVSMRKEVVTFKHHVLLLRDLVHSLLELRCDALCSKLLD